AQIVNIPDPIFKQALLSHGNNTGVEIDTNYDGEIQVSEAEAITDFLDVNGQFIDITDLTGIEAFINIIDLNVRMNQLTSLDLSQNTLLNILYCSENLLSSLNISQCTVLEELWAGDNQLTSLDLSNNVNLTHIYLYDNLLISLDLTQNIYIEHISVSNNQLTFFDFRNAANEIVLGFSAHNNPDLTCIFVNDADYSSANWSGIDENTHFVETQEQCDAIGIDEVSLNEEFTIYPNPVKSTLSIDYNSDIKIEIIQLYNVLGKLVLEDNNNFQTINVESLQNGIYLVKITTDHGSLMKKIIKL
ncbi:MAG: T9SS type A sorting domain-containing protein, partial [Bacteroidota bacterium]